MLLKSLGIITKKNHAGAAELAAKIEDRLAPAGVAVHNYGLLTCEQSQLDQLSHCDLVLVLGGDGTIVRAARAMVGKNVPVAGINLGAVGFLAELSVENWAESFSNILEKGFTVEKRLALHLSVQRPLPAKKRRPGQETVEIFSGYAVNDVVLSRGGVARLLAIDLAIDHEQAAFWRADGIIISTPTGSTGYTGSAGGPLLSPALHAYAVTAICPFLSRAMPLVLSGSSTLTLSVYSACTNSFITLDGQEFIKLKTGDILLVNGVPEAVHFARFGVASYFEKLHSSGLLLDSGGRGEKI